MSKLRKLYALLIVMVALGLDLYICQYTPVYDSQNISLTFHIKTNVENEFQMFYEGKSADEVSFDEKNSIKQIVEPSDSYQELTYKIPVGTKTIRMDFGEQKSTIEIQSVKASYKKQIMEIPVDKFVSSYAYNDLTSAQFVNNNCVLECADADPYVIWNMADYNFVNLVKSGERTRQLIVKTIYFILLNGAAILFLKKRNKIFRIVKEVRDNKKMIWSLAKNDFKTQFAGSYLGIFWAFVQPVVTVLVYWFVFQVGLKNGNITNKNGVEVAFVLWLIAGLVPWFFYSDALNGGTSSLLGYSYLVKKVVFNINVLPIVKMISAFFVHAFFVIFMLVLYSAYGFYPDIYTLQVLYYSICMFVMVLGVSYATSAIVVFFRDLTQLINVILQIQTWMTPIMWNIDTIKLSAGLKAIFKLNPMYYIVNGYRDALINKVFFWERIDLTIYFWMFTLISFTVGITLFRKLKIHFADVL